MIKRDLVRMINDAMNKKAKYFGVKIKTEGMPSYELIINQYENLEYKLSYYINAYNEDLTLKSYNGIKIIGAGYSDDLKKLDDILGL